LTKLSPKFGTTVFFGTQGRTAAKLYCY